MLPSSFLILPCDSNVSAQHRDAGLGNVCWCPELLACQTSACSTDIVLVPFALYASDFFQNENAIGH